MFLFHKKPLTPIEPSFIQILLMTGDPFFIRHCGLFRLVQLLSVNHLKFSNQEMFKPLDKNESEEASPKSKKVPAIIRGQQYAHDEPYSLSLEENQFHKATKALALISDGFDRETMKQQVMKPLVQARYISKKKWKNYLYEATEEGETILQKHSPLIASCLSFKPVFDKINQDMLEDLERQRKALHTTGRLPDARKPKFNLNKEEFNEFFEEFKIEVDTMKQVILVKSGYYNDYNNYRTTPNQRVKAVIQSKRMKKPTYKHDHWWEEWDLEI